MRTKSLVCLHDSIYFLQVSACVLGPDDEQYIHPPGDDDDEDGGMLKVLMPPHIDAKTTLLRVSIFDCEDMARMDDDIGVLSGISLLSLY